MKPHKMNNIKLILSVCICVLLMAGCGNREGSQVTNAVNEVNEVNEDLTVPETGADTTEIRDAAIEDAEPVEDDDKADETSMPEDENENTDSENEDVTEGSNDKPEIIWIGDSLTQGSLGDDNHNENNPQAPWRVLGEISGRKVAGVGFYGYVTSDIFWAYGEYNGIKDPDIIYVYWVGSNDFYRSPDNVKNVIEETDRFNENAGITKFLMLGTTDRHDMDPKAYIPINKTLEEYYGDKYLDIIPYVEYGPDGVHLTEESYAAVAAAVNDKLNELYQ